MMVRKEQEWRVQRWDGRCWRQGLAMTREQAQKDLLRRHLADPKKTLRVVQITTLVEAAAFVGPRPNGPAFDAS